MRKHISRRYVAPVILSIVLIASCGGQAVLTSLRLALASSGPLVNSLVAAGAIPQGKAQAIITDFTDGTNCAITLQSDFKLIPKDDPESRPKKLEAASKAAKCWRVVVDRQNFAANPKVQNAANIVDGIFASLVIFYSPGSMDASVTSEKALEERLKKQVEDLKLALKP